MSEKAFAKIMRDLEAAKAYLEGERTGYKVTVPPSVHSGSSFQDFLEEEGILEEVESAAIEQVRAWQKANQSNPDAPSPPFPRL